MYRWGSSLFGLLCFFATVLACAAPARLPAPASVSAPAPREFGFAQPYFELVGDSNQIPYGLVTAMAQDSRGLLWLGTQYGLLRYDGYRFRKFLHAANDPASLPGNYVDALHLAADGRLWVATQNDGLAVFDPASERFGRPILRTGSLAQRQVRALIGDGGKGLWVGTEQGLLHLAHDGQVLAHWRHDLAKSDSLHDERVHSLLQDRQGRLWVGTADGLQRMSRDGRGFEPVLALAGPAGVGRLARTEITALMQGKDGKIWLGSRLNGAAWLDPDSLQIHWLPLAPDRPDALSHGWVNKISQPLADQIWLATMGGGINVVDANDGRVLQHLRHDPGQPGSLAFDEIGAFFQDNAGLLWIGSRGAGLQRYNSHNQAFQILRRSNDLPQGLSHPNVRSVLELADGRILVGTGGNGIDMIDRQRGLIGGYRAGANQTGSATWPVLPDGHILSLAQTRDGALWAGTQQAGVVRLAPGAQKAGGQAWQSWPGLPAALVRRLLVASDGTLWAGTRTGLARCSPGAEHFDSLSEHNGKAIEADILALQEDAQGRIWAASDGGLWVVAPGESAARGIHAEPQRAAGLVSDFTKGLLLDRQQRLWVSTDKGLERLLSWDGQRADFEHVSHALGQPGTDVYGNLLLDAQERIWGSRYLIETKTMQVREIGRADGFDPGTVWLGAIGRTRDGLLLHGGTQGLAVIYPERYQVWSYAPPLVVTELKINGQTLAPGSLFGAQPQLRLEPAQRNFSIEFSALDYSAPQKNRYRYRLLGYEQNWIEADFEHRSASYGNLWPGRYTLQISGSNRLGQWSSQELLIPLLVLPAWYQSWWFGLLSILLILFSVVLFVRMRTRFLRQRQSLLVAQVRKRTLDLQAKKEQLIEANRALHDSNAALNLANDELTQSVATLRQLGEMGRSITANLDEEQVFQSLYRYVNDLLDTHALSIYRMDPAGNGLEMFCGWEGVESLPVVSIPLDSPISNVARAARERIELLRHFDPVTEDPTHLPGTSKMLTALYTPLIVDDRVLGVMTVQSERAQAYGERECQIFHTLCAYGAIALANAEALGALQQAQSQLVQQEKLASLGGLVGGIAHEINTPLGTILLALSGISGAWQRLSEALEQGRLSRTMLEHSTQEGMEYTELAERMASRTADLVSTFKTIAMPTESDALQEIDLAHFVPELANLIRFSLEQHGSRMVLEVPDSLPVRIVPDALTEAITRILSNVIDHAFTDGKTGLVTVRVQVNERQEVCLVIADNGRGICPINLPRVFDPFFTTKSGMHGHIGLGLHVAYNHVVQRLKGTIGIVSTLGQGTTVTVRFRSM
jgi:ligand-binding sensor domain-containing protein/signal transduction histidine kinase